jgi:hypothetical protein
MQMASNEVRLYWGEAGVKNIFTTIRFLQGVIHPVGF